MSKKDYILGINRKKLGLPWVNIILVISVLVTIIGALFSTKILTDVNKNIASAKEAARPANIRIIKITAPDCADCFNVNSAVSEFKKLNIKIEEEKNFLVKSKEAQDLIKKFNIKKIPTYIATGEVKKNNLGDFVKNNGEVKNDTFIFTKIIPVYINTSNGKENGRVTVTLITDPSCSQCPDIKKMVDSFEKSGVKIKETKEVFWNSAEGQNIISRYKLAKVPAFILSPEFDLYDSAKSSWQNFGTVEDDKTYVARNIPLPYRDLITGQITGLVSIIYLTDSACSDCYKVQDVQKPILTQGYGVALQSERFVDAGSSEGQNLINKYNISKIPTIILSPEVDQYVNLKNIWKNVGIVETDGWYVFTGFDQLTNITYKDLTSGEIIKPAQQEKNQGK